MDKVTEEVLKRWQNNYRKYREDAYEKGDKYEATEYHSRIVFLNMLEADIRKRSEEKESKCQDLVS